MFSGGTFQSYLKGEMTTFVFPCQQFNSCNELVPKSRKLLSKDAQRVLGIFDRAIKKCLLVLHMSDIITDETLNSGTLLEDNVKRFAVNLLELASAYENLRIIFENQSQLKASELCSSTQEYCKEQQGDPKDDT
ncbi:hypothetical protein AHF37_12028, partial [Paragonimus kellicotti]